jgi:hypothetical protein
MFLTMKQRDNQHVKIITTKTTEETEIIIETIRQVE